MLRWIQTFALAFLACLWPGQGAVGLGTRTTPECACECESPAAPPCGCDEPARSTGTPCDSGSDRPTPIQARVQVGGETWKIQGMEPAGPHTEPDAWPVMAQIRTDAHDAAIALLKAEKAGPEPEPSSRRLARLAVFRI